MVDEKFRDRFAAHDLPNRTLREVYTYWLKMKGDKGLPTRADLDPVQIPHLLPNISLIDVEYQPRRYRMRLIGTETVRALGEDPTGTYLDDNLQANALLKSRYDWLVENKRPYFYCDKLMWSDKKFLEYQTIGLPLSRNGVDVDIIMFGINYDFPEEMGSIPMAFGA